MEHSTLWVARCPASCCRHQRLQILYNAAVAMTGGQDVDGGMTVPELTRSLEAKESAKSWS